MRNNRGCHYTNYPERCWVQFLILRVLCEKPSYGYKIAKLIEKLTEGRYKVKLGTIYTLLQRMERNNLLISRWKKDKQAPDKKIYQVTKKGENLLKKWLEAIIERKQMMDKIIKFYQKHFRKS